MPSLMTSDLPSRPPVSNHGFPSSFLLAGCLLGSVGCLQWALSYARVLQEARVRQIGEPHIGHMETCVLMQDLQARLRFGGPSASGGFRLACSATCLGRIQDLRRLRTLPYMAPEVLRNMEYSYVSPMQRTLLLNGE